MACKRQSITIKFWFVSFFTVVLNWNDVTFSSEILHLFYFYACQQRLQEGSNSVIFKTKTAGLQPEFW